MSATQQLDNYARTMLAGFARLLLTVPVGELPEALRSLAGGGGGGGGGAAAARPRGRPPGSATATVTRIKARRPGEKRSAAALEQLTTALQRHIADNSGSRMEAIAKALGTTSSELALPVQKLLESGAIRKEGNRRATQYYPGRGGSGGESGEGGEGGSAKPAAKRGAKKGARGRKAKS